MTPELTRNLQVIAQRFPSFFEELKSHTVSRPDRDAHLRFLEEIYPPENSSRVLDTWLTDAPIDKRRIIVTSGFGDGRHLEKLLQSLPTTSRIAVVEADLGMFLATIEHNDKSELLKNRRILLLSPFSYRETIKNLNEELIGIQSSVTHVFGPIFKRSDRLYQQVLTTVNRELSNRWNQLTTDVDNAEINFQNTLENLSLFGFGSQIGSLYMSFKDKPLILVAAGPSLDESFDFLKNVKRKAAIAVVNSAYRAVVNNGIIPDFTVAVDPKEGTFRGYEGTNTNETALVCSYIVYPEVSKTFEGRIFPLSSHNVLISRLFQVLNLKVDPGIIGDGTVSSTVVNLAAFMGCSEIYLLGQDMAVRPDGQTHTKDSFYTDDGKNRIDTKKCRWVESNCGESVPVEEKLYAYLRIFENQVSNLHKIKFYNLSKLGARIHGANYLPMEEALIKLTALPDEDYAAIILDKLKAGMVPDEVMKGAFLFFRRYADFLKNCLKHLMKFAVTAEIKTELHELPLIKLTKEPFFQAYHSFMELINENTLFATLLVEGRGKWEYREFIQQEEEWSHLYEEESKIRTLLPEAWAIVESIVFQLEVIDRYFPEQ